MASRFLDPWDTRYGRVGIFDGLSRRRSLVHLLEAAGIGQARHGRQVDAVPSSAGVESSLELETLYFQ